MRTISERAVAILCRQASPAMPLSTLHGLVRAAGMAVTEDVLLHTISTHPDHFRVIATRPSGGGANRRQQPRWTTPGRAPPTGSAYRLPWEEDHWVVPSPAELPTVEDHHVHAGVRRMRTAVVVLGWHLDGFSKTDRARWLGMVMEMERFGARLAGEGRRERGNRTSGFGAAAPPKQ